MPITTEKRIKHRNNVEKFKREVGEISVENRKLLGQMEDQTDRSGDYDGYRSIALAFNYIKICEIYLEINKSSEKNLNKKSDNDLKEARSNFSNSIRELERWTKQLPDYLADKDQYMEKIKKFNPARQLQLMKDYNNNIRNLYEGFTKKSRWWGNVVSLEGQVVNVFLFLVNYKDLSNPHYLKAFYDQKVQLKMKLIEWIKAASNSFREKYMLQTRETGDTDIKLAINLQEDLLRIASVLGERDEAEQARKTIDIWTKMREKDAEEREKKMNRRR